MSMFTPIVADVTILAEDTPAAGGGLGGMLPFLLIAVVGIVAMQIFSSRKRKQQAAEANKEIVPGTRVVIVTGMVGEIVDFDGSVYTVKIDSEGRTQEFVREGIRRVLSTPDEVVEVSTDTVDGGDDTVIKDQGDSPTPGMITGSKK